MFFIPFLVADVAGIVGGSALSSCGGSSLLKNARIEHERQRPKPSWIDNPPKDHYVGVSWCDASMPDFVKQDYNHFQPAYGYAMVKKCKGTFKMRSHEHERTSFKNGSYSRSSSSHNMPKDITPVASYRYPCEGRRYNERVIGSVWYYLFNGKDLDCSKVEK